ncbi:unnamed protein product [marine sediment metagenome]|uniref:Uncharacterized protein n=1 Tax=marine sediment metagenome TaxID=412755 RepID=X0S8A9_9ZZZZ
MKKAAQGTADYQLVADPVYGGMMKLNKRSGEVERTAGTGGTGGGPNADMLLAQDRMPAAQQGKYMAAWQAARKIPLAMKKALGQRDAFGFGSATDQLLPEMTPTVISEGVKAYEQENFTPEQKEARAAIYSQASVVIKEMAGSAVSEAEKKRIEMWMPAANDSIETIYSKLSQAFEEAMGGLSTYKSMYGTPMPEMISFPELNPGDTGQGEVVEMDGKRYLYNPQTDEYTLMGQ